MLGGRLAQSLLRQISGVAQHQERRFHSCKHNQKTVVDSQQHSVVGTPLVRRTPDLYRLVHIARDHDKITQQQEVEPDGKDHPKERAYALKNAAQAISAAAESNVEKD